MAQSKEVGLIGTALYLFASYRLINVHIRESVGEYTAMCFLPLVIYGIWRIYGIIIQYNVIKRLIRYKI